MPETVNAPGKEIDKKKLDEPHKDVLAFMETDEVSRFKSESYQVSLSIEFNSPQMGPFKCVFGSCTGPNIIRADILDPTWLDGIGQRDMSDTRSASDTTLEVARTMNFNLLLGESWNRENFGVVSKWFVPVLLGRTNIDRFIKWINASERKIVP